MYEKVPASEVSGWHLARTFLVLFIAGCFFLLGVAGVHYYSQYRAERLTREAGESVNVELLRRVVVSDVAAIVSDTRVLARLIEQRSLMTGTHSDTSLAETFRIFAEQKRLYDQIRFIDLNGRETVRVNFERGRAEIVAADALQDKSNRYYFRSAGQLDRDGIYVSPFDLNVEQGQIEQPLKPVMRFATPVFDDYGNKTGIVVVNYLGQLLLDKFIRAAASVSEHVQLLNQDGFWLFSSVPGRAWGFMFGREKLRFSHRFPEEWPRILAQQSGQFATGQGLFTFVTVRPMSVLSGLKSNLESPGNDRSDQRLWKIISRVPSHQLVGTPRHFLNRNLPMYVVLLGLLALGSLLLARSRFQHRQAEVRREYEKRFRQALEDIKLAAVSVDRDGAVSFCNRYFLELTGWQYAEVVGSNWIEKFTPKEQQERIREVLSKLATPSRFPAHYEAELETRNRGRRLIAWNNTLTATAYGGAASVTAIGEDITQKRQAEAELRKLHRAVEQSRSIVVITNSRGLIEYINPAFTTITGYTLGEVMGKNPRFLKSGYTGKDEYHRLWQTIGKGGEWRGEFHNRKKNGELYWEAASISAVRNSDGEITHFLAVKEDITERKRLEGEVDRRNRELAKAQVLAEIGRMASMIAHDLRNPLSSVKMALQIFNRQGATTRNDEVKELQGIALEQVAYMEDILSSMLTYSRPAEMNIEWISADKLMDAAIALAQRKIDETGVNLVTRYQSGMPTFPGDKNQLRQVFSNLISNAVQATEKLPRGSARVQIRVARTFDTEGTRIRFEIIDNGCGFKDSDEARLFEPFYTNRAKGTGLGLAIVKKVLDQHRGSITLTPNPARGVRATVLLPTVPAQRISDDPRQLPAKDMSVNE